MPEMVVTGRMQDAMREVLAMTKGVSSEEMSLLKRHADKETYSLEVVELLRCKLASKPWLHELLEGSSVAAPRPLPAKKRNPENEKRLAKIRHQLEEQEYAEMVKDVRREEIKAGELGEMQSYKSQLGEGMTLVFGKLTAFAIGFYASRTVYGPDPLHNLMCGLAGLVIGLLVDGTLLVLRSTIMIENKEKNKKKRL